MVEARCIGLNGTFLPLLSVDMWISADPGATYVVKEACVIVQRTSNRLQQRRINAAELPQGYLDRYGDIIGKNHVIFVRPYGEPVISPRALARLFNSRPLNDRFARICGTISLPVSLLNTLDMPDPAKIQSLETCPESEVNSLVEAAYSSSH